MSVVKNEIAGVMKLLDNTITSIVRDAPENMRNDIRMQMNGAKSGRIYTRRSITHQASAPGEAPAIDTAAYVSSIETRQISPKQSAVQSNAQQALALELGNPSRNLLPRPAWIPAAKREGKHIAERLTKLARKIEHV